MGDEGDNEGSPGELWALPDPGALLAGNEVAQTPLSAPPAGQDGALARLCPRQQIRSYIIDTHTRADIAAGLMDVSTTLKTHQTVT